MIAEADGFVINPLNQHVNLTEVFMIIDRFFQLLLDVISECSTKSVFGNIGVFYRGAMFAQFDNDKVYVRGGPTLDHKFKRMGCSTYIHVKKQSKSAMNYYDISDHIENDTSTIKELVVDSCHWAYEEQIERDTGKMTQLRHLPNLNHTLEKKLISCQINTVEDLHNLGAVKCYIRLQDRYPYARETYDWLWRLYGAIHRMNCALIPEEEKKILVEECNKILWDRND
ncbi:TfoX/Sxy family DNA transformation protein [Vibrio sp. RC27]